MNMDRFQEPPDDGLELFIEGICDKCSLHKNCTIPYPLMEGEGCAIIKFKIWQIEQKQDEELMKREDHL